MRYRMNPRYGRQLLTSNRVARLTYRKAEQVRDEATAIAGVDTGEYINSWSIDTSTSNSTKGDRQVTNLTNTSYHASAHEWGRGAHRPLQRALESVSEEVPD